MEAIYIKERISEAIRLLSEQTLNVYFVPASDRERSVALNDHEYCDSLACSEALEILENLLEKL